MAARMFTCFGRGSSCGSSAVRTDADTPLAAGPVLVELFCSQGCATSQEAESVVSQLQLGRHGDDSPTPAPEVVVLAWHVDYWDYRGWKDPFGSSAWTVRQKAFVESLRLDTLYTPQAVVIGRAQCLAGDAAALSDAVRDAPRFPSPTMQATFQRTPTAETLQIVVSLAGALQSKVDGAVDVMVALCESGVVTECLRGENKGKVIANDNVVRRLEKMMTAKDGFSGKKSISGTVRFSLWEGFDAARCGVVVFVQNKSLQTFGVQCFRIPDTI